MEIRNYINQNLVSESAGNTASLARRLAGPIKEFVQDQYGQKVERPVKIGFEVAGLIADSQDWSYNNVVNIVASYAAKTYKKEEVAGSTDYDAAAAEKIAGDNELSKNERFRQLYEMGVSVSEIAKMCGVTYQRVKNITRAMDKKK